LKLNALDSERIDKKDFECAQRELACDLMLENEMKRLQTLHAQMQSTIDRERQDKVENQKLALLKEN
jgi:hypothetical protein